MLTFKDEKARAEFKRKVREALGSYKDKELNDTEIRILFGLRSRNIKRQEDMKTKKDFGDDIKRGYSDMLSKFFQKKKFEALELQKCVKKVNNMKRRQTTNKINQDLAKKESEQDSISDRSFE